MFNVLLCNKTDFLFQHASEKNLSGDEGRKKKVKRAAEGPSLNETEAGSVTDQPFEK